MSKRGFIGLILLTIPLGLGLGFLYYWLFQDSGHLKIDYKKYRGTLIAFQPLGKEVTLLQGSLFHHVKKETAPHYIYSDRLRFKILGDADVFLEVLGKENVCLGIDNGDVLVSNGKDSIVIHGQQSIRATMDTLELLNCRYSAKDSLVTCMPDITMN